jgi:hypothetical protein
MCFRRQISPEQLLVKHVKCKINTTHVVCISDEDEVNDLRSEVQRLEQAVRDKTDVSLRYFYLC